MPSSTHPLATGIPLIVASWGENKQLLIASLLQILMLSLHRNAVHMMRRVDGSKVQEGFSLSGGGVKTDAYMLRIC